MYACTGRYRISMGVTGMASVRAIVGGERDARQLAKLRDRPCPQVAPTSSSSRPCPPSFGAHAQCFLLPRSIPATLGRTTGNPSASSSLSGLLLVFSRFFDILLSAFRTRQPGRPTLGFWSSFLSQHTSALGV